MARAPVQDAFQRGRPLVVGNWKMNGLRSALTELAKVERVAVGTPSVEVAVALPYTLIAAGAEASRAVAIGSQDVHFEPDGAHTGCVSAEMAHDAGATFTILGHSEVRARGERGQTVRLKLEAASLAGLIPLLCIGESLAARQSGRPLEAIAAELSQSFVPGLAKIWIAYEPLWAIGTGRSAGRDEIEEVHSMLRETVGPETGLLYGGSVSASNAQAILDTPNVDGVLVGGASLHASSFIPLIEAAAQRTLQDAGH